MVFEQSAAFRFIGERTTPKATENKNASLRSLSSIVNIFTNSLPDIYYLR